MIENIIPRKLGITTVAAGYTKVYLAHSTYSDADVQGKIFWVDKGTRSILDTHLDRFYTVLSGFTPNTQYTLTGAYYDSMVDDELLAAKVGLLESDPQVLTTLIQPTFSGHTVESQQVDVGVGTPYITFNIQGEANVLIIEKQKVGDKTWEVLFTGTKSDTVTMPLNPGTYNFRTRGYVHLPDGVTSDVSVYDTLDNVLVEYQFNPPSKPTNITFKTAKVMDGIERYDVKVEWDWVKATGTNVREFVLYFVTEDEYNITKWQKASTVNGGASKSTVITGFPFNKGFKFKVDAVAWGPDSLSITSSDDTSFIVDNNTTLDSSFTTDTNIEVTYAHIKAYRTDNNVKKQTFLIDAGTGSVAIGELDQNGKAPISLDPVSGKLNVEGSVITKEIVAASVVLSNLTGTDNPSIRTANKNAFASAAQGLWAGYDSTDSLFKFDLGSDSQYLRWDGKDLVIAGNVKIGTPGGNIDIGEGITGNFVANIYKEAATVPTQPASSDYPPTGWSSTPITATAHHVWISSAIISSKTGSVDSASSWSSPARFSSVAGTDGYATISVYQSAATKPVTPTEKGIPPAGWFIAAPDRIEGKSIWMINAIRKGNNATIEGAWSSPTRLSGDDGIGTRGPGIYRQSVAGLTSFDSIKAAEFFQTAFTTPPVAFDVLTQYSTSDLSKAYTRQWNGTSWTQPALVVSGDIIADGSITSNKLVADSAFLNTMGVNIIYDNPAVSSGDPERNYKMKIDLNIGSIHIR